MPVLAAAQHSAMQPVAGAMTLPAAAVIGKGCDSITKSRKLYACCEASGVCCACCACGCALGMLGGQVLAPWWSGWTQHEAS